MTTKQEIIKKVNAIENPDILDEILNLIEIESDFEEIYAFTDEEKTAVNEGLKDLDEGRSYSNKDSKKIISKWLKEQSSGL
jgi:hypothetical protein